VIARRLAAVAVLAAVMLGTVLLGAASARPTATLPRPSTTGTAAPTDVVSGIAETVVSATPLGRLGSVARNLFRLAQGIATVDSFVDYFDEGDAVDAPQGVEPFAPNGPPSGAYAVLSMNTVERASDGIGVVMTLNYAPNAALQNTDYYGQVCQPNSQAGCYFGADGNRAVATMNGTVSCRDDGTGEVYVRQNVLLQVYSGQAGTFGCDNLDAVLSAAWGGGFAAGGLMVPGSFTMDGYDGTWVTETRVSCVDTSGGSTVVVGTSSVRGTATVPPCAPGSTVSGVEVWSGVPGALQKRDAVTVDRDVTRATYPECVGGCQLSVLVDGVACTVGAATCYNWQAINSDRLSCKWGPYSVSMGNCTDLAYAYRTGRTVPDTTTGTWVAANPQGQPDPVHAPNVTEQPNPGTGTNPDPGTGTGPQPQPNPGDNCWGEAVSWNPLDWVLVPVKCALAWAFVPEAGTFDRAMTGALQQGPGPWIGAFADLIGATGSDATGNCRGPGWTVDTPWTSATTLYVFDACDAPQSVVAGVVKVGLTVLVWIGAGVVCVRLIGSAFGLDLNGVGGETRVAA